MLNNWRGTKGETNERLHIHLKLAFISIHIEMQPLTPERDVYDLMRNQSTL